MSNNLKDNLELNKIREGFTDSIIKLSDLEIEQNDYIKTHSKYLQKKRYKDGEIEKEVHEYVCPNGKIGYQIFFYIKVNDKEYVKSVGFGQEAKSRTFDLIEMLEK